MRLKIRCDGKSEKFCKNFLELNKALVSKFKNLLELKQGLSRIGYSGHDLLRSFHSNEAFQQKFKTHYVRDGRGHGGAMPPRASSLLGAQARGDWGDFGSQPPPATETDRRQSSLLGVRGFGEPAKSSALRFQTDATRGAVSFRRLCSSLRTLVDATASSARRTPVRPRYGCLPLPSHFDFASLSFENRDQFR